MNWRRVSAIVLLVGALAGAAVPVFAENDCLDINVIASLAQGAFVGVATDARPEAGRTLTVVAFDVSDVFTGPITEGSTVDVWFEDGPRGWQGLLGEPVGVFPSREDGRWTADMCRVIDADTMRAIAPSRVAPSSLGTNDLETLKEPPLWIFFGIFGGGIGGALLLQRRRRRSGRAEVG